MGYAGRTSPAGGSPVIGEQLGDKSPNRAPNRLSAAPVAQVNILKALVAGPRLELGTYGL
jgi:hypothetical protein